jgi:hypothetical protein
VPITGAAARTCPKSSITRSGTGTRPVTWAKCPEVVDYWSTRTRCRPTRTFTQVPDTLDVKITHYSQLIARGLDRDDDAVPDPDVRAQQRSLK